MFIKRRSSLKYVLGFVLGVLLYGEWIVYIIQPLTWNKLMCSSSDDSSCVKILFIADPQIQGDMAVPPPYNYLYNWDSDRFVRNTFIVAVNKLKPDILVYLGDLMDEGSISTMAQYHHYVKRLFNIFEVNYPIAQVWLPGDNDIGGEFEPIVKDKVAEFNKVFSQPEILTIKGISFHKVNNILMHVPKVPNDLNYNNSLKIVVSHYAVTNSRHIAHLVKDTIKSKIFFCAHEHKAQYLTIANDFTNRKLYKMHYEDPVLSISLSNETFHEIYVPTCSYRMGTDVMGFGAAIIEKQTQEIKYTVFWSSRRFFMLYVYFCTLIVVLSFYCIVYLSKVIFRLRMRNRAKNQKYNVSDPLLAGL